MARKKSPDEDSAETTTDNTEKVKLKLRNKKDEESAPAADGQSG